MRESAVIVPVAFIERDPYLLLIRRSRHLPSHPGQVGFPGGKVDDGETSLQAALREMEEEIGVGQSKVTVVANLETARTATSDYIIRPYLALVNDLSFRLNPDEVEELLFVLVKALKDALLDYIKLPSGFETPRYRLPGLVIWGATARILRNSLAEIERSVNNPSA